MALRHTSVASGEVYETLRFEPRYFLNRHMLSDVFSENGYTTIQDIADIRSGSTPAHFDYRRSETDAFFIKSASVRRYSINKTTICYVTKQVHESRKNMLVFSNDVLITNTGKYLGFASIVPEHIPEATTNQNITCVRLKKGTLYTPAFLEAYLNSYFGQQEIESLLTRTGQKYLNSGNFRKLRIPLMAHDMIKRISNLAEQASTNETAASMLIAEAQNLFYNALNNDIRKINREKYYSANLSSFKDEDLWTPEYSNPLYNNTVAALQSSCELEPLGLLADMTSGNEVGSDAYIEYLDKAYSDVPFIRTTDVMNYDLDLYPDFYVSEGVYSSRAQGLRANDIIFSKDGKLGMVGMLTKNDKAIIASGFSILRLTEYAMAKNITPEYLFLVLSIKEIGTYGAVRRAVVASTITHLRDDRMANIEIPILNRQIMDKITNKVRMAFELKAERKKLIKQMRLQMDEYLRR